MNLKYGMGSYLVIPYASDKYKEKIDSQIEDLVNLAYQETKYLLLNSKQLVDECARLLVIEHELPAETIIKKINNKYSFLQK